MHDSKETNGLLHCLDTVAQTSNLGVVKCRQQEKSHKVIAMLGGRSYKGQHDEIPTTADLNDLVCHLVAGTHAREQCSCRSECLIVFRSYLTVNTSFQHQRTHFIPCMVVYVSDIWSRLYQKMIYNSAPAL